MAPDPKRVSERLDKGWIVSWLAVALSTFTFGYQMLHNDRAADVEMHERLAKLEASVEYIKKSVDEIHQKVISLP